jgi:uncharacterized protein YndB with AHSA1/START domain
MHEVRQSIEIAAPVTTVFDFVADFRNALEWMYGFNRFEPITAVSTGQGARVKASGRIAGMPMTTELEITQFIPNHKLVSVSRSGFKSLSAWVFEPVDLGTKITFIGYYELPLGRLGAFVSVPWLNDLLVEHTWKSLKRLKQIMEAPQKE